MKTQLSVVLSALVSLAIQSTSATVFTNDTTIAATNSSFEGADIVVSNCTLTVEGPHTFASLLVAPGGRVTHSYWPNGSLSYVFSVTDEPQVLTGTNAITLLNTNLTSAPSVTDTNHTITYSEGVDYTVTSISGVFQLQRTETSSIPDGDTVFVSYNWQQNVAVAGLNLAITGTVEVASGGAISANGNGYGYPYGIGRGGSSYDGSGGGYGGYGGGSFSNLLGGVCYGSLSQPINLGSPGGSSSSGYGGNGGGAIRITCDNMVVDGVISANGANATNSRAGGGAGGSVWIIATNVSGSGSISANGGNGEPIRGGGGGGGRISIQSETNQFTGTTTAFGGNGWKTGGAGTIYLKTGAQKGLLLVDNGGKAGTNTLVTLSALSDVVIRSNANVNASGAFNAGNLTIATNSALFTPVSSVLNLSVAGNLDVQAGGILSADQKGNSATIGTGAGHGYSSPNTYPCSGAGYGGNGGLGSVTNALGGATYGSQTSPATIGSGGGSYSSYSFGGTGGGAISINVSGTLIVNGRISANGGDGSGLGGGGGSGGGIQIVSTSVSGAGVISANGGNGVDSIGGGGGGGRIYINSGSSSFTGNVTAFGGSGANYGGAGTVLIQTNGQNVLVLDNAGHRGTNTAVQYSGGTDLIVRNGAVAWSSSSSTFRSLSVGSNAAVIPNSSLSVTFDAKIETGGAIFADAMGSPAGTGNGAGKYSSASPYFLCSGAGHGGFGGNSISNAVTGGTIYDNYSSPFYTGSGGGTYSSYSVGGAGGGVIQLTVNGTLQNNGVISANGGNGSGIAGGGGSGGSIRLSVGTFSGSGSVSANGGLGANSLGGGGGGGMIAVTFNQNSFSGSFSAYGGDGANAGGAGAIYLKTNNASRAKYIVDNGARPGPATAVPASSSLDVTLRNGSIAYPTSTSISLASLTIESNAWLMTTNSGQAGASYSFNISGGVTIQSGGGIKADGFGYSPNNGPGAGHYTYYPSTYRSSGAGHGGYGANSVSNVAVGGLAYDTPSNPTQAGSGGGASTQLGGVGGNGGGAIQMDITGSLQLDGTISANGINGGGSDVGGGSGGTVNLRVGELAGSGRISANGGDGGSLAGGGAGGMIAIRVTSNSFAGTFSAFGGGGANWGGAGTIYQFTNLVAGASLIVDNAGHRATNTPVQFPIAIGNLILRNGAIASPAAPQNLVHLFVGSNCWITPSPAPGNNYPGTVSFVVNGNATIQSGGGIITDSTGSTQNNGTGRGFSSGSSPYYQCTGAGHGGYGANTFSNLSYQAGGTTYDSLSSPISLGSGGGGSSTFSIGGSGGGYVNLRVTGSLQLDGRISANGGNGSGTGGGGGSGGSIQLNIGTLTGAGSISANGGFGANSFGGGGGGGRIAISHTTNLFAGSISAFGGGGANWGGAGTIFFQSSSYTNSTFGRSLVLDNGGNFGTNTTFDALIMDTVIQGGAVGVMPQQSWTAGHLLIRTNGTLTATASGSQRTLASIGNIAIEPGGVLSLDACGYGSAAGPAAGLPFGSQHGGGGHGGYGGANPPYAYRANDSIISPSQAGSGGANNTVGSYAYGGYGGGALQLTINGSGTLQVGGKISADGGNGQFAAAGGAGGSINIVAPSISGSGIISASGGIGSLSSGGGGGGRIAINCASNNFTGQIRAGGGVGYAAHGGAGTIYLASGKQLFMDNLGLSGTATPLAAIYSPPPPPFDLTLSGGAQLDMIEPLPLLNNLSIGPGSIIGAPIQAPLLIAALKNVTVASGSAITADARGFAKGYGPGAGGTIYPSPGQWQGAGGGYGGNGGNSALGALGGTNYGSTTQPTDLGSGGGSGTGSVVGGSAGGGAIRLSVGGTLTVDGQVRANGDFGWQDDSGGGSGGSIWITAGALTGVGTVSANGGDGDLYNGGGGGGGRIAIYSPANSSNVWLSAEGGDGAMPGEVGTVFLSTNLFDFTVTSHSPSGTVFSTVSIVDLNFSDAVDSTSVSTSGLSLATPTGPLPQSNITVSAISPTTLRLIIPVQNVPGDYSIQVNGGISSVFGQTISQVYTGAFTIELPIISGTVYDTNGLTVAGVTLQPTGGLPASVTDTNGHYAIGVPPSWGGTITPHFDGFMFVPGSLTYSNVLASVTNQNYLLVETIAPTLDSSLNGTNLQLNWSGMAGVSYQVQWSTNLVNWQPLGDVIIGTNGAMQFSVPMTNDPTGFFRVQASD